MLRENSRLRNITIGQVLYTVSPHCLTSFAMLIRLGRQGQWVRRQKDDGTTELDFEVIRDVVRQSWI